MSDLPIRVRSVLKRYPRFTLQDIDLDVSRGRVRADSGEVSILGRPMPAEERWIKARVGFVSEDMALRWEDAALAHGPRGLRS